MDAPRLKMMGVRKRFGATQALKNVSFEVAPGEVHALIGENGAGKSTLMKILSAACRPDEGSMEIDGEIYCPRNPLAAGRAGVAMIYQELNLAPDLSVAENIVLGAEPSRFGFINTKRRDSIARAALEELGCLDLDTSRPTRSCTIAEQQLIEIARALAGTPRIIVMDEPTSSLTQHDSARLFQVIRKLRARNVSIIYISHFLEECQQIADRFTVLRDGETVGNGSMETTPLNEIVSMMAGRPLAAIYPSFEKKIGKPVLAVKGLRGKTKPRDVTFDLREGEIFGLAGLVGAGRTEAARALFGLDVLESGEVFIWDRLSSKANPAKRLKEGFGFLSENRKEEGLLLNRSISENLTMSSPVSRFGFMDYSSEKSESVSLMEQLKIKARDSSQVTGELSGGNQQKIALGRLLHQKARILILDEPTRGIDMGSKAQIYELLCKLAAAGKSVLFISSYFPELLGVCDRIGVVTKGELTKIKPASEWNEHSLISAATGAS